MKKPLKLVSLGTALAALSGVASLMATDANANTADVSNILAAQPPIDAQPNMLMRAGKNLLGMTVTKKTDGTIVADHYSHSSHASHSSHSSHYSSR